MSIAGAVRAKGLPIFRGLGLPPAQEWAAPAFLICLGVGALIIGLNHLFTPSSLQHDSVAAMAGREYADVQLTSFDRNPALIRTHAAIGTLFVIAAAFQFRPSFRIRHPRLHRVVGFVGLACLVLLPITGVACTLVYPFAGTAGVIPNLVWTAVILVCAAGAMKTIRERDVLGHQIWMTRATAMTLGITLSRLYEPVLVQVFHMQARPALALVFWLGQGEGLAVAETWLRRPRGPVARRATFLAARRGARA